MHDDQIKTALNDAHRIVIINVVTYGHNALHKVHFPDLPRSEKRDSHNQIVAGYLDDQRKLEISKLREFLVKLGTFRTDQIVNFITVLNKMDLWWQERATVEEHYRTSEYAAVVEGFSRDRVGEFSHETLPLSMIMLNLRTSEGMDLSYLSPGFDAMLKDIHFDLFTAEIAKYIE